MAAVVVSSYTLTPVRIRPILRHHKLLALSSSTYQLWSELYCAVIDFQYLKRTKSRYVPPDRSGRYPYRRSRNFVINSSPFAALHRINVFDERQLPVIGAEQDIQFTVVYPILIHPRLLRAAL